jgi:hypothetical protein
MAHDYLAIYRSLSGVRASTPPIRLFEEGVSLRADGLLTSA